MALALVVAGCAVGSDPTDPDGDEAANGPLRTDRVLYIAEHARGEGNDREYEFTIVARYTNGTGAPIYLDRCFPDTPYPIYGVGLVEGGSLSEAAYSPVWGCVGHDQPIVVEAGDVRVDTLRISGPNGWDGHTGRPFGAFEGLFRLVYDARSCPDAGECDLPESERRSNVFEVRLER